MSEFPTITIHAMDKTMKCPHCDLLMGEVCGKDGQPMSILPIAPKEPITKWFRPNFYFRCPSCTGKFSMEVICDEI